MYEQITEVDKLQYHRNGVDAESYYSCIATLRDDKDEAQYLITFNTDEKDIDVIVNSCRVIKLTDITATNRGDNFARWLNAYFSRQRKNSDLKTVYDFCRDQTPL